MGNVPILENVESLPDYVPGASGPGSEWVKLSSNENPYPPIPEVVEAGAMALRRQNRYPQMYADRLCAALGEHYGQPVQNIVAGNGSVALLNHAVGAVAGPGDFVVEPWRSFEAYPIVIGAAGAEILNVSLTPNTQEHDLKTMAQTVCERAGQVKAVLLCSPNNPTGPALTESAVRDFLGRIPSSVMVILDEAYIQFTTLPGAVDGLTLLSDYPNLVVARTFSKAYQLAGLRVGWMAGADRDLMNAIRKVSTPFGVNMAGAAAAVEALNHEDEMKSQVEMIVDERERTVAALRRAGWKIPDAQGNFYWLKGKDLVEPIVKALAAKAVMARAFPEGVRISVGLPSDNDRVIAALTQLNR